MNADITNPQLTPSTSSPTLTVAESFHKLYYHGAEGIKSPLEMTSWMGLQCLKCPLDLWVYQEILFETRPDVIIETGTWTGASTLFLAQMLDILGNGVVVSIDIVSTERPLHDRIRYVHGSSDDAPLINAMMAEFVGKKIMVILDSDHREEHVLRELTLFAPYVSVGQYLIVEDTNINGHPAYENFGRGPYEAVAGFLSNNKVFVVDSTREKFLMTLNPGGYLKRVC